MEQEQQQNSAVRVPVVVRYDMMEPNFEEAMARILAEGHEKYDKPAGVYKQWQRGLDEDKSPINHAKAHIAAYIRGDAHQLGSRKWHLAAAAVNLMFEFWFEERREITLAVATEIKRMLEEQKNGAQNVIETDTAGMQNTTPPTVEVSTPVSDESSWLSKLFGLGK
jgi:hypothetical protein